MIDVKKTFDPTFDTAPTIASLIKESSLEGILRIIKLIESRDDVAQVSLTTLEDLEKMEAHYKYITPNREGKDERAS